MQRTYQAEDNFSNLSNYTASLPPSGSNSSPMHQSQNENAKNLLFNGIPNASSFMPQQTMIQSGQQSYIPPSQQISQQLFNTNQQTYQNQLPQSNFQNRPQSYSSTGSHGFENIDGWTSSPQPAAANSPAFSPVALNLASSPRMSSPSYLSIPCSDTNSLGRPTMATTYPPSSQTQTSGGQTFGNATQRPFSYTAGPAGNYSQAVSTNYAPVSQAASNFTASSASYSYTSLSPQQPANYVATSNNTSPGFHSSDTYPSTSGSGNVQPMIPTTNASSTYKPTPPVKPPRLSAMAAGSTQQPNDPFLALAQSSTQSSPAKGVAASDLDSLANNFLANLVRK
jgi:hypothetical protein